MHMAAAARRKRASRTIDSGADVRLAYYRYNFPSGPGPSDEPKASTLAALKRGADQTQRTSNSVTGITRTYTS